MWQGAGGGAFVARAGFVRVGAVGSRPAARVAVAGTAGATIASGKAGAATVRVAAVARPGVGETGVSGAALRAETAGAATSGEALGASGAASAWDEAVGAASAVVA